MMKETIFWDVDTQFDFMRPEGKLYVPEAEHIIDKVSEVRKFALENGFSIIADVDWHGPDNEEISQKPDFKQTFPPHCMAGEPGSERVGYLGELPIEYIDVQEVDTGILKEIINKDQFHIVIRKQSVDVFSNPNTDALVELVRPGAVVAFGVALDVCVYYVLKGLSKFPGIKLSVLMDAVKGLQIRPDEEIFDDLRRMGVEITQLSDLKRQLICG